MTQSEPQLNRLEEIIRVLQEEINIIDGKVDWDTPAISLDILVEKLVSQKLASAVEKERERI